MSGRVTFINHATALIQIDGTNILTDPVYSFSISYFLPRFKKPGIPLKELPPIDIILISHDHYDHLNLRTLRRLQRRHQARIILSKGNGKYAARVGFEKIDELDWGDSITDDGVKITAVPARHFSGRKPWGRNGSVYAGFVIEKNGKSVYFAGDTAYDNFFADLGKRFSLDVALLPIGAYKPND